MANLHSTGIQIVSSIPTHTPVGDQATWARLQNTNTFYFWNGTSWDAYVLTGDADWFVVGTTTAPAVNTDTMYHDGVAILGGNSVVSDAVYPINTESVLQLHGDLTIEKKAGSLSALDIIQDGSGKMIRMYSPSLGFTDPWSYFNDSGAYYSTAWMTISGTRTGTGPTFSIEPPSLEPMMIGIWSDVAGPCLQARISSAAGSHIFSVLDLEADHRWKLEGDGKMRWGITTLANMDTDLWREDAAKLTTTGSFGLGGRVDQRFPNLILQNIAIGNSSSNLAMTGNFNTVIGASAGNALTTESHNIFIGASAGQNAIGASNIGIGSSAMRDQTGDHNIGIGLEAMFNYTGDYGIGIGYQALKANVTGIGNLAIGELALTKATNQFNVALGTFSLGNLVGGAGNIAVGYSSLNQNVSGSNNLGIGTYAGNATASGGGNIFLGSFAGFGDGGSSTAQSDNVVIGVDAGYSLDGDGNIMLGRSAGKFETTSNKLYLHNAGGTDLANGKLVSIIYGEMDATTANQNLHLNANTRVTYKLTLPGIPIHADEAAAIAAGLAQHTVYKTATGELRIKL